MQKKENAKTKESRKRMCYPVRVVQDAIERPKQDTSCVQWLQYIDPTGSAVLQSDSPPVYLFPDGACCL